MLIADLIHSCTNEGVALAALASLGRDFHERVQLFALKNKILPETFIIALIKKFELTASDEDKVLLHQKTIGSDQPLLTALRLLIEEALEKPHSVILDLSLLPIEAYKTASIKEPLRLQ